MRILRQSAIIFRLSGVVQYIDYARAADARRVIYAGFREIVVIAELLGASLREELHVVFAAEMQATCGARFDACRLQPFAHAVRTQRAFVNPFGRRIEFRDVEGASADAVAAADAVGLLEIDDAIGVLHDGPVRGTRRQTSRLGTMHA